MKKQRIFLLYIIFTFNNIFYILMDVSSINNLVNWTSCGRYKVKGLKKITVNSIKLCLNFIILNLNNESYNLHVKLKGFNKFKKIVLKILKQLNLNIISLSEEIPIIHGGCRQKKKRKL